MKKISWILLKLNRCFLKNCDYLEQCIELLARNAQVHNATNVEIRILWSSVFGWCGDWGLCFWDYQFIYLFPYIYEIVAKSHLTNVKVFRPFKHRFVPETGNLCYLRSTFNFYIVMTSKSDNSVCKTVQTIRIQNGIAVTM